MPVQATMHVATDGFVQMCAQVVDDVCEGGVVVRGVDGVGLYVNVTRFDWVSGYEEPQIWLVRVVDGVFDDPAGFGRDASAAVRRSLDGRVVHTELASRHRRASRLDSGRSRCRDPPHR
ncbi:MAG: hypothetical protein U0V56_08155 [Actinomycetota bacterium]